MVGGSQRRSYTSEDVGRPFCVEHGDQDILRRKRDSAKVDVPLRGSTWQKEGKCMRGDVHGMDIASISEEQKKAMMAFIKED